MSLVEIKNAVVTFQSHAGKINAVDDVTLTAEKGEILAVVGESGCGKTTLARSILGLQKLSSGKIMIDGAPVNGVRPDIAEHVGMVWQDPYASLDPRWTVGRSAMEPGTLRGKPIDLAQLFQEVGLPTDYAERYPHQLSGGQRQRVAIARALALRPPLVLCDEPTAALDLSIRAQILMLLKKIQKERGCTFIYISHDLSTVRFLADRVAVMYFGKIIEVGPTEKIFTEPKEDYTRTLLNAAPTLETLGVIPGSPAGISS